jgi:hypothetical protein
VDCSPTGMRGATMIDASATAGPDGGARRHGGGRQMG